MIIDTLDRADTYTALGPRFKAGFDFLRNTDLKNVELGRHEIDGDNVFANVQTYTTKSLENGIWEAHRTYADIQYIVAGRERMGLALIGDMTETTPYDAEKDAAFFDGEGDMVRFTPGMFGLYLPQDVHMPGITDESPDEVRKVVVKVRLG